MGEKWNFSLYFRGGIRILNQLNWPTGHRRARCRMASQLAPRSPPRPRSLTTSLLRLRKTEPCPPALSILLPPARSLSRFLPLLSGLGARARRGCRGKAMPHPPSLLDTSNHLSTQPHAPPAPPRVVPQPAKRRKAPPLEQQSQQPLVSVARPLRATSGRAEQPYA